MQGLLTKTIVITALLVFQSIQSAAQKIKEPKPTNPDWEKPYQPFRIAGNLYYVGTYDLASYLIVTSQGNILINTGLASSAKQIKANIETLGLKFSDIKILLTTQAHYDHMGAMATIKKKTKAVLWVNAPEADVLKTGGASDYALGGEYAFFKPVTASRYLHNGDTITLGETQLVMLSHPGHTQGSCSYIFTTNDSARSYRVLVANMPTIVTSKRFADLKSYPDVSTDYAQTLKNMKLLQFDIWVASHAGQFSMHDKHKPGDRYNPMAFADQAGYIESLNDLEKDYQDKLRKDAFNQ